MRRLVLVLVALVSVLSGVSFAGSTLIQYATPQDFGGLKLSHAKWDAQAGGVIFDESVPGSKVGAIARGLIESPEIPVTSGFDHAIASWNASTPSGSYLSVYIRSRVNGVWTSWYCLGLWTMDNRPMPKTTFKQDDAFGMMDTETLKLKQKADAFKIRLQLESSDGKTYPTVRYLAVNLNDSEVWKEDIAPVQSVWGKELDVPYLCQLSVPGGNGWCSATSTAMLLSYWSKKLHRPELNVGITKVANNVYDKDYGGTGDWSFNVAYAGSFKGIRAYVTRFTSVSQIEQWIAKGVPVIVSVNHATLKGEVDPNSGHLMVIRGFTKDGDPVFNDPWARLELGEKLRKIYPRERLEAAWLTPDGSWGTVYMIHPEKH